MRSLVILVLFSELFYALAWNASIGPSGISRLQMSAGGRRPLIAGNWKLNPSTLKSAETLASDLSRLISTETVDVAVFPPFPLLTAVRAKLSPAIRMGGQDCFYESSGAYTGAVSTELLEEVGCSHVLIGHSERRTIFQDTDAIINRKVKKALSSGLTPVLCIGETKEEYETGLNQQVCAMQLLRALQGVSAEQMARIVLAYEPVWAIGTGLVCPKEVAQEVHAFIRGLVAGKYGQEVAAKTIIQYGGSVNAGNVKELMAMPDIDGCLVGGASLTAESFAKIVHFDK